MAKGNEVFIDGKNVKGFLDGDKLTIEIDLAKDFGPSKTGKTNTVASTNGFQTVAGVGINLNVCKKR